ncbi:F-box/LRR-repeat protein [Trifolium repens]|nr:F-box/LRR-repeat protein [Trifolium repens]
MLRRKIKINSSNKVWSNFHPHLSYIALGSGAYPIDESSLKDKTPFKYKRQRHNSSNNRDMISDLPDYILHHILSFLPTEDAVKTSILATNWSCPTIQFRIVNPPTSILDAYISFGTRGILQPINKQRLSRCSLLLLSGLANVKSLTLAFAFFEIVHYNSDNLHLLPEFHNLTHLCLDSKAFTIPIQKVLLGFLLPRCPKLEVLVVPLGFFVNFTSDRDYPLNQVPPCFKSSLKILHITNFDEYGIKFAKFLLENARLLEEIQITYASSLLSKLNKMADLKNQLVGMGSCAIKFQ